MSRTGSSRILIIDGHPDQDEKRFGHALVNAYKSGAESAGHETRLIQIANLEFPVLRKKSDFENGAPVECIRKAQEDITWADHVVIVYPLWLGTMPALLKAFFEQTFRPGFAFSQSDANRMPKKMLNGKSAKIIVTMGMPSFIYRWFYRAHSLKNLERNVLSFAGFSPIRETLIGMVESGEDYKRKKWLTRVTNMGRAGK